MHTADGVARNEGAAIRVAVLAGHHLDGESLAALLRASPEFCVLCSTTSPEYALSTCRYALAQVLVCDATWADGDVWADVTALVRHVQTVPVLLLDDEVNLGRLAAALSVPAMGYFTRSASFSELANGLRRLAAGERIFQAILHDHLKRTSRGWKLLRTQRLSPLGLLTPRETEVMRLVALGKSVRDCARILALAQSTVDNHKARMMKKLGLRKSQDLTRLAIREGLIHI